MIDMERNKLACELNYFVVVARNDIGSSNLTYLDLWLLCIRRNRFRQEVREALRV